MVDVGTSRADYKHARREGGYRTVGDVSPAAYPLCAAYTPVPGGVRISVLPQRGVVADLFRMYGIGGSRHGGYAVAQHADCGTLCNA